MAVQPSKTLGVPTETWLLLGPQVRLVIIVNHVHHRNVDIFLSVLRVCYEALVHDSLRKLKTEPLGEFFHAYVNC